MMLLNLATIMVITILSIGQMLRFNLQKRTLITHRMLSIVTSIAFVDLKYCWTAYLQQYARFAIIY